MKEYRNEFGDIHRIDGPACEYENGKFWYINGELHREDGPAIEYTNGRKLWFLNGTRYTKEKWQSEVLKLKLDKLKQL